MSPEPTDRAERLRQAIRLKTSRPRESGLPRRPPDEPAALGELQQSLWLAQQLEPRSPAYNMVSAFELERGALDPARLQDALRSTAERHRILTSAFVRRGDTVEPSFGSAADLVLERFETEGGNAGEIARREARRPFALDRSPLIRLLLVDEPASSWLVLVVHHLLADERSLEVFWNDFGSAYRGEALESPDAQYDDWVHSQEGSGDDEASLAFWRRRLEATADVTHWQLPEPDTGASTSGEHVVRPLPRAVVAGVRDLAARRGTTPFAVYHLAADLVLRAHAVGPMTLATPMSVRQAATAEMIGYFLNPVVVGATLEGDLTLDEALDATAAALREVRKHAALPFARLLDRLELRRVAGRHPLFQALFVSQQAPEPPKLGVPASPRFVPLGASKFELTLFANAGEEDGEVAAEFETARFARADVELLLERYAALLERLIDPAAADCRLSELPVLLEEERALLASWSRTPEGPSQRDATCLPEALWRIALDRGEEPAIVCDGDTWSYRRLAAAAAQVAAELCSRDLDEGRPVGLFIERSPELVAALLGAVWAGVPYVPLDPRYPKERHRQVVEDARLELLLASSATAETAGELSREVFEVSATAGAEAPADFAPKSVTAAGPVYVLYTSGSSGRPKGVVVRHGNLAASTWARPDVYGEAPGRFLLLSSAAFDSSVAGLFWTLATGGTLLVPTDDEARDSRRLAELADTLGAESLLCVPSLWEQMRGRGRYDALRTVIVAGEACPPSLARRHRETLPEARLFNEYGPTEATVWSSVHEVGAADEVAVPIGRPIPGVTIRLLDALGREVPPGFSGTAWIEGPTVTSGYLDRPERTAASFAVVDGRRAYCTGDAMRWSSRGELLFLGRIDDQVKLRGHRIELGEIEAVLREVSGVRDVAVVLQQPAAAPQRLAAFVRLQDGAEVASLRAHALQRLPEVMVPAMFERVDDLPRLPNGKVDRAALEERVSEREDAAPEELGDTEAALARLWSDLLGLPVRSRNANFFELGGHSLLVVEMAEGIERDHGVALEAAEIFERPTIAQLAERVDSATGGPSGFDHLFPLQPTGSGTPFVMAIPHFFADTLSDLFRDERPVYGLRGVGLRPEGNRGRWPTMESLGRELAEEIRRRFGDRPVLLGGYSFGASMAFEAARELERQGVEVRRLVLIAPMPLDRLDVGPLRLRLDGLQGPVSDLTPAQIRSGLWRSYRPLRRLLRALFWTFGLQPWRRLRCALGDLRRAAGRPLTPGILHADVRLERFRLHRGYRPGSVDCPVAVFNPTGDGVATDAAATWSPHFGGDVDLVPSPDPHHGEQAVEETKRLLSERLRGLC